MMLMSFQHQGPLPTPQMLEDFDRVVPGLARKIVERSELELHHRHKLETSGLDARIADQVANRGERRIGQILAFVLALFFGLAGTFLVVFGYQWAGGAMATTTVVGLVTIFITGRSPDHSKTETKEESDDE